MRISNLILILLTLNYLSCIKDVNCHPRLNLTLVNNSQSSCAVKFYDRHKWKEVRITIQYDSLYLEENESLTNTINYYWSSQEDCFFGIGNYEQDLHISANINKDSVSQWINIYPWDTSKVSYEFDSDCTHEIFDTLFIDSLISY